MAVILPTTPIEMPDLAGQAFKLQEYRAGQKAEAAKEARDQQDRRGTSIGLDKAYAQGGEVGRLLSPYIPETQKAFQDFIKAGEQYKYSGLESDKQAFLESQNNFNALFGSALEKSNSDRAEIASFAKKPSAYAVSGDQFNELAQGYLSTPLNKEQILNPMERFVLPVSEQLKFMQPNELAEEAVDVILGPKKSDFSPDGVSFNKSQAIDFAQNQWLPSMLTQDTDAYNKAIIYGARKRGWKGLNNRPLSASDVEELIALPQDQKDLLLGEYVNDTMNQIRQTVPNSIGEYDKKEEDSMTDSDSKKYMNLAPSDTKVQPGTLRVRGGKSTFTPVDGKVTVSMYELPSNLFIGTRKYDIAGFGKGSDGRDYIRTISKTEDGEVRETRRLTKEDRSVLKNKLKGAYYEYFDY
jgi:hypothetical protein